MLLLEKKCEQLKVALNLIHLRTTKDGLLAIIERRYTYERYISRSVKYIQSCGTEKSEEFKTLAF